MVQQVAPGSLAPGRVATGVTFAVLTMATHTVSLVFVVAAGRLLAPEDFGALTALLGIVLVGMAPGMAVQALTATGTLGGPVTMDAALARRLSLAIAAVAAIVVAVTGPALGRTDPVAALAIAVAAGVLPRTAANEGVLQGRGHFVTLGIVLVAGATVKLVVGVVGMAATGAVWAAAIGVALGYLVQVRLSHRWSGGLRSSVAAGGLGRPLLSAVLMMGSLLALVHVDALIAQVLLDDLAAGQYAVGTAGARVVFWAPQFAVLLLFPRLVRDHHGVVVVRAMTALAVAGLLLAGAATLLGPWLVRVVFGGTFDAIGAQLWRFAWLGTAALGLQVLALADLAAGRRDALRLFGVALLAVLAVLGLLRPTTAVPIVTTVAVLLTAAVAVGTASRVRDRRPASAAAARRRPRRRRRWARADG